MKRYILMSICMFRSLWALAQQEAVTVTDNDAKHLIAVSWEIAFPVNNNYLNRTSFGGLRAEYRNMISPQFSAGVAVSWNSFEEHVGTRTYTADGGSSAVTTDMIRQVYTVPVTAIFHYYPALDPRSMIKPYLGLGLGVCYAEQYSFFNVYEMTSYNWGFAMRPELGTLIRMGSGLNAVIGASYQYASNKNYDFKINSLNQFAVNLGIACSF